MSLYSGRPFIIHSSLPENFPMVRQGSPQFARIDNFAHGAWGKGGSGWRVIDYFFFINCDYHDLSNILQFPLLHRYHCYVSFHFLMAFMSSVYI